MFYTTTISYEHRNYQYANKGPNYQIASNKDKIILVPWQAKGQGVYPLCFHTLLPILYFPVFNYR